MELTGASEEAKQILQKINDYSFKLFMPCNVGTGWILDYIIPEDGSYPTTWFIATNAHVVSRYKFKEATYGQEIPDYTKGAMRIPDNVTMDYSQVDLFTGLSCTLADNFGFNGFNLSKESTGKQFNSNRDAVSMNHIKPPKLFYVPTNFLGQRESIPYTNYQKDFAVLEIEFTSPDIAQKLTNNFHNKYYNKGNALNLFDDDLLTKNRQGIIDPDLDYYSFAYPSERGKTFNASTNYNTRNNRASQLTYTHPQYSFINENNQLIRGHANSSELEKTSTGSKTNWNNKSMHNIGYHYVLDNMNMTAGSSGGIFADKHGNILGINRLHDPHNKHAFIEPLRSAGAMVDGKEVLPKYDLIRGVDGQVSSYKSQLEKYHNGKRTFLSERGWK